MTPSPADPESDDPPLGAAAEAIDGLRRRAVADAGRRALDLFAAEPGRIDRLTVETCGLYLDVSKQNWSLSTFDALLELARLRGLEDQRDRMFAGARINRSEGRAALHPALRGEPEDGFSVAGLAVGEEVAAMRRRVAQFAEAVRTGAARAADGGGFASILHIGIGGSDLGPRLVWEALRPVAPQVDLRFVSNIDPDDFRMTTADLDPRRTLVIVVSKTFTTLETLANAHMARNWLAGAVGEEGLSAHLAAVSTALDRTGAFGVAPDRVFGFWDWVGGRFSLWSSVGLSLAIGLGPETFARLLDGARAMDRAFLADPLARNAPVMLALAQVFNRTLLDRRARVIAPYSFRLRRLPAWLQQLEMESNGKTKGARGETALGSSAVVLGEEGSNLQHAFLQQVHQGPDVLPVEFVCVAQGEDGNENHRLLNANAAAQGQALIEGLSEEAALLTLLRQGMDPEAASRLAPQKAFPGDRPSTTIVLDRLNPERLGSLLCLYEHKAVCEGFLWGLNSFDQWGVELGKTLANRLSRPDSSPEARPLDPSTAALRHRLGLIAP